MLIALTLVAADREHDVRLPAAIPVVALREDLHRITDVPNPALALVGGRRLDDDRSLLDNGLRDGAILQVSAGEVDVQVIDDVVDAIPSEDKPHGHDYRALAILLPLTAAASHFLSTAGNQEPPGYVALVAAIALTVQPRVVARLLSLAPDSDPGSEEVGQRLPQARRLAQRIARASAILLVIAGTALCASSNPWAVAAGWACVVIVLARFAEHDSYIVLSALSMSAIALFCCLRSNGWPINAIGGLGAAGGLLVAASARPNCSAASRLARERVALAVTVVMPALLVVALDAAPVPWE